MNIDQPQFTKNFLHQLAKQWDLLAFRCREARPLAARFR